MKMLPFHRPSVLGDELRNVEQVLHSGKLAQGGPFGQRCATWLEEHTGAERAFVTPSGTAALELAAAVLDIRAGDEVVMPSWTFVATASAFALRGAAPVFIDVRPDTLNLDERELEAALGPRTKAVVPVHYAGVAASSTRSSRRPVHLGWRSSRTRRTRSGRATEDGRLGRSASLACCRSTREERDLRRGRRAAHARARGWRRAPRSSQARGRAAPRSCGARWTTTSGSTRGRGGAGEIPCAVLLAQLEQLERATERRRAMGPLPRAAGGPRVARARTPAARAGPLRRQRTPVRGCGCATAPRATRSSLPCASAESGRSFTTSRCTTRPPGGGSGAPSERFRSRATPPTARTAARLRGASPTTTWSASSPPLTRSYPRHDRRSAHRHHAVQLRALERFLRSDRLGRRARAARRGAVREQALAPPQPDQDPRRDCSG